MEPRVSKLSLIDGNNVVPIKPATTELNLLVQEAYAKKEPTDQDLVVYAYKFVRIGHLLNAQKQLGRVSAGYFDMMIYRDLFKALHARSQLRAHSEGTDIEKQAEYFNIVERSLTLFEPLNFPEKPAFYRFRNEFKRMVRNGS